MASNNTYTDDQLILSMGNALKKTIENCRLLRNYLDNPSLINGDLLDKFRVTFRYVRKIEKVIQNPNLMNEDARRRIEEYCDKFERLDELLKTPRTLEEDEEKTFKRIFYTKFHTDSLVYQKETFIKKYGIEEYERQLALREACSVLISNSTVFDFISRYNRLNSNKTHNSSEKHDNNHEKKQSQPSNASTNYNNNDKKNSWQYSIEGLLAEMLKWILKQYANDETIKKLLDNPMQYPVSERWKLERLYKSGFLSVFWISYLEDDDERKFKKKALDYLKKYEVYYFFQDCYLYLNNKFNFKTKEKNVNNAYQYRYDAQSSRTGYTYQEPYQEAFNYIYNSVKQNCCSDKRKLPFSGDLSDLAKEFCDMFLYDAQNNPTNFRNPDNMYDYIVRRYRKPGEEFCVELVKAAQFEAQQIASYFIKVENDSGNISQEKIIGTSDYFFEYIEMYGENIYYKDMAEMYSKLVVATLEQGYYAYSTTHIGRAYPELEFETNSYNGMTVWTVKKARRKKQNQEL